MAEENQISKTVLVVCTGNTCRSPMAEGWLNQKLADKGWRAESAGVVAWGGSPATLEAIEAMKELGIDISGHRNQTLTRHLVNHATLILAMTEGHRLEIIHRYPEVEGKTFLVKGFGAEKVRDVVDPVGLPIEAYRHTRDELVQALGDFLLHLAERGEIQSSQE